MNLHNESRKRTARDNTPIKLIGNLCVLVLWFWPGNSPAQFNGFSTEPHSIPLEHILSGGPPKDGIPALLDPKFLLAKDAAFLHEKDRILGVSGQRVAKAYPLKILNWHEVVNDTLENQSIVITYCPLCGSGMGFSRNVDDQELTFGVSGLLYQSDVLMYDHQTESLWSQILRKAVTGELLGHRLRPIIVEHTTWGAWKRTHPDTLVLSANTGYQRNYHQDPYAEYAQREEVIFPILRSNAQFFTKEWVLGIEISEAFKAYPFSELKKFGISFHDTLNTVPFIVCWNPSTHSAKIVDLAGNPLPSLMTYWFAWYTFHPQTSIFSAPLDSGHLKPKNWIERC